MKKSVVYAIDALEPNNASLIAKDLNDDSIEKIIIPTFLLKEIKRNFNFNQLYTIIEQMFEKLELIISISKALAISSSLSFSTQI